MRTRLFILLTAGFMVLATGCSFPQLPYFATVPAGSPTPENGPASAPIIPTQPLPIPLTPVTTGLPLPATATPESPILRSSNRLLPQYTIQASMDYDAKTLDVQEEINYPNTSEAAIPDMLLAVEPNRTPGVFSLANLSVDDQQVTEFDLDGQRLYWKFAVPLQPGQSAKIRLGFKLTLPEAEQGDPNVIRPQIFGVTTRQVNLTDWYPMVVPFESGAGWRLASPWFYGEHLVYPLANFEVALKFTDPATAPVIAASAEGQPVENGMHYVLENGRDFVLAMGRQFKVYSTEAEGVTVASYYYPGNEIAAQAVLDATVRALKTYSSLFGPYQHKSLSAVQGDFNDGMEFDGLFYLSNSFYNLYDGSPNNYLPMVAAHETSHQWWFSQVANDQAKNPWLDESLATYCEELFYEKNYPDSVKWWWSYRVDFYQPEGKIDGEVASYGGFTPYTNATYRLGARFLDELRRTIGDKAFFDFLKDYGAQMTGQIATPEDFFRILKQHTSADLSGLFEKYFSNPPRR